MRHPCVIHDFSHPVKCAFSYYYYSYLTSILYMATEAMYFNKHIVMNIGVCFIWLKLGVTLL